MSQLVEVWEWPGCAVVVLKMDVARCKTKQSSPGNWLVQIKHSWEWKYMQILSCRCIVNVMLSILQRLVRLPGIPLALTACP
jgi:hypothetical protein